MPVGIGGSPVRVLPVSGVTAWVETVGARAIGPTLERVQAHDSVVSAALAAGVTPLPARFGQTFESDDDCRDALRAVESRLLADLARVDGFVEMRLLVVLRASRPSDAAPAAETPGRAYMQRLLRGRTAEQAVDASAAAVRAQLAGLIGTLSHAEISVVTPSPTPVLTISHLVARADVARYRAALEGADAGPLVERLVVTGPVAPYQFASPPA